MNGEQQLIQNPDLYFAQRQKLVKALFHLWATVIPDHQPTEDNFAGWFDTFGAEVMAKAIRRTADKARTLKRQRMAMDGPDMERYCTGTAKHLGREAGFTAFRAK